MKTTLNLDDELMLAARERARRTGMTLTALISDALRSALAAPAPVPFRLHLPVTRGRRMPTIDIDSNAAVEDYLDGMTLDGMPPEGMPLEGREQRRAPG